MQQSFLCLVQEDIEIRKSVHIVVALAPQSNIQCVGYSNSYPFGLVKLGTLLSQIGVHPVTRVPSSVGHHC